MKELNKLEKEALAKQLQEVESSPEVIKIKQKIAREQDKLNRLVKKESEKARRERNHRLIFLGATIEQHWGSPIVENSKEMGCLIYYLPQIKKLYDEGKYNTKWEELKQKEKAVQDKIEREEAERQERAEQAAQNEEEN